MRVEILIKRKWRGANSTVSVIYVDGKFQDYILEDIDRDLTPAMSVMEILKVKIKGKTAIPTGRYPVTITYSNRFKRKMPLLGNVKGFAGIRIHPGNTHENTDGCLLPGTTRSLVEGEYQVGSSRLACTKLEGQIQTALSKGEKVWVKIVQAYS